MATRPRTTPAAVRREGGMRAARRVAAEGADFDQLAKVQRARIVSAMVEVCYERGAAGASVGHVVKRSGVSRRTFYEMFDGREDCLAAAFEQALASATARVAEAYDASVEWSERVRAGLIALLCFLDEEPRLGRLLIVESLSAGPAIAERRARTISRLTAIADQGVAAASSAGLPELTGEGVVGAVLAVIQNRLLAPRRESLVALANQLTAMAVLPYLGAPAARRELKRRAPKPNLVEREPLPSDPFKDMGMRLTYRTVQVLDAVAEHPGASNRAIGAAAEMTDQGQISKLLSRLERIGMLANTGIGAERGGSNAWSLTERGARVVQNIRAHTVADARPEGGR